MEKNFKIITEDNFNFLVTKTIDNYWVDLVYTIPRKSKKGYLGMKHHNKELKTINKEEALKQFANWKEDYTPKFYKKEILSLRILYSPNIRYFTTCPKCGDQAEILTWMVLSSMGMGEDREVHNIICEHCFPFAEPIQALENVVGECHVILMGFGREKEDKKISLDFNNSGIKWEDWIKELKQNDKIKN